ncbi:MAG TPA: hypothetical protein VEC16_03750 [Alphaproteobacteria bacterium]|nr:hypothetical protein [Alphaproteobacteria bacterium]
MSNDRTSIYILAIVAIVALVGAVYMVSLPSSGSGNALTGNVVSDEISVNDVSYVKYGSVFKTLLGLGLVGAFVFMYHKF